MRYYFDILKNKKYIVNEGIWSIAVSEINNLDSLKKDIEKTQVVLDASNVTDIRAKFVADPFVIKNKDKWYMFFEIYDELKTIGCIGVAESGDGLKWNYKKVVLKEDFHLSYPNVFKYNNEFYMIPETGESGYIKLYKSKKFPYEWECIANIIEGVYYDATIFFWQDKWWIFTQSLNEERIGNMNIFYSDNLEYGWKSHKLNPVIKNSNENSRAAGNIIIENNMLYRVTQYCKEYYGQKVFLNKIISLNENEFKEETINMIASNSNIESTWNKDGMHTVNIYNLKNSKAVIVDGYFLKKENLIINKLNRGVIKLFNALKFA